VKEQRTTLTPSHGWAVERPQGAGKNALKGALRTHWPERPEGRTTYTVVRAGYRAAKVSGARPPRQTVNFAVFVKRRACGRATGTGRLRKRAQSAMLALSTLEVIVKL